MTVATTRRTLLAGGLSLLLPRRAHAAPSGDIALRTLLDGIDPDRPGDALRRLERIEPADLSAGGRLDLAVVRHGLALDERIAGGDRRYPTLFARQHGLPMTARRIAERLRPLADALTARADALLRAEGLSAGSVGARLRDFARQERWLYPADDAGRDAAVADMNRWLLAALERVPALIAELPADARAASVTRLSAADIAAGRRGNRQPAGDGRPALYQADLQEIGRRPRWSLPGVVHHELVPGHLVDQAFRDRRPPHPLRLRYTPAFSEGWATYAEQLADEAGLFGDDRPAVIGHLQWMLFRVGRGLADAGIHGSGWTDAQAIGTLRDLHGDPAIFAPFETDVARIRAEPGVRAAEAMTWIGIARLRARHAPRLDGRAAAFHRHLLGDGPLPFALLETGVARGMAGADNRS